MSVERRIKMRIKLMVLVAITILLLNGCASVPAPKKFADDFHYLEVPDVCFFPIAEAKWDGYKITNKNWNKLDDYLKLMFIIEATQELQRREKVNIVSREGARTLRALNYGIDKLNRDMPQVQIVVIDFLYDVLKEAKLVTPKKFRTINR